MGERKLITRAHRGVWYVALFACTLVFAVLLTGCGPTSGQLTEREAASLGTLSPVPTRTIIANGPAMESAAPVKVTPGTGKQATSAATSKPPTSAPTAAGTSGSTPAVPPSYTLAANQADMDVPVQKACSQLLSRAAEVVPAKSVSTCITAAMRAGTGANVVLETLGTGLPGGRHTVQLRTAPEFGMFLQSPEIGVSVLLTNNVGKMLSAGQSTAVDADGDPDERSAAIVAGAARVLLDPKQLGDLLETADAFRIDYAATGTASAAAGAAPGATVRLTAVKPGPVQGVESVTLDMLVDPLYRPLQLKISGSGQGIPATTTVSYSKWGTPVHLPPAG